MVSLLLAATLAFSPADAQLAHRTAAKLVAGHTPRDGGSWQGRAAATFIYEAINRTGLNARCDSFKAETPSGPRIFTNVESDYIADPAAPWVVLVSHYDTKPGIDCPGANDGASTTGLLVGIGNSLFDQKPRNLNVRLLWTDGEESQVAYGEKDGFWGSRHAAEKLRGEGLQVLCVVCLDMLGDSDLKIGIPRNGSPGLRRGVLELAETLKVADKVVAYNEAVKDDHVAFVKAGFKAIDLIDFEYGSAPGRNDYWHTPKDTIDKISEASLAFSGRFVLAILDGLRKH